MWRFLACRLVIIATQRQYRHLVIITLRNYENKDKDGNVMTDEESVLRRWKEYYMGLMNEENERERREIDGEKI